MERNLGAIFHGRFILSLPAFAIPNAHSATEQRFLWPNHRHPSGRLLPLHKAQLSRKVGPWANYTSEATISLTDYKRRLSN